MQILKDKIIWGPEDFLAGLVPSQGNNEVRIIGKNSAGATFERDFDPYVVPGIALPGYAGTNAITVSVVDGVLLSAMMTPDGTKAYMIGGSKFHELTISSNTFTNAGSFPHSLAGAGAHAAHNTFTFTSGDVVAYNVGANTRYFYSYNDATDWDVGMYDGTNFDDDFMTSVPATPLADNYGGDSNADYLTLGQGKPHPLYRSSNDDILYIGSGRYVHAFDGSMGSNGTFTGNVFTLPVSYECIGFAETGYDLVVFLFNNMRSGRRGTALAYFYGADRSADPYKTLYLDDDEIAAPFNYLGTIGCFTRSRNSGRCCLRIFDGNRFTPRFYWSGNLPAIGGVEIQNNLIKWNTDGIVYMWGEKDGEFPLAAHINLTGGGTSCGLLKSFISGHLYMSSGSTTSGGLQIFSSNYSATAAWQGLSAFPTFPAGKVGRVKEVKVTFWNTASGGRTLDLQFVVNGNQTTKTIFSSVSSVTTADMVRFYRLDSSGNPLPKFESLKPVLSWGTGSGATDAPGVKQIEAIYELRNV